MNSIHDLNIPATPVPRRNPSSFESGHDAPRRRFIRLVGGGAVLAATPLISACASGMPEEATRAWRNSTDALEARPFMLAHALLAPNPHNRQPWIADLRREGEITLSCDGERLLPHTDPFGRQILIGCGAFIELAVIAASQKGLRVDVRLFPEGEPALDALPGTRMVARLVMTRDASLARDPLFEAIRRRHTNKTAYDSDRLVPAQIQTALVAAATGKELTAGVLDDAARIRQARAITRAAYETECITPRTWLESAHLLRVGPAEIRRHRDGISLTDTNVRLLETVGLWNRFDVPAPNSSGYSRVMARWDAFESGSGYFWLSSRGNGRVAQVEAGRAYLRAQLAATVAGVDMHPLSQALQEFVEMRAQYNNIHQLLKLDPARDTLQMFARIGYARESAGPTPRRELAQMVRA